MDYEITRGKPGEYEDIIDFANRVFQLDFCAALPKLYRNHMETASYHHMVKENGHIKAIVGSFPLGLEVCGKYLRGRGIGTVSVHPDSRNSGYMRILMDRAVSEMTEEACDFSVLSGQRQRYEYWGFTPCGILSVFRFNRSNIRHCHIEIKSDYRFAEFDSKQAVDLEKAIRLHDSQPLHAVRKKEDFLDIAKSWTSQLFFIYKQDVFAGYLSASDDGGKIREILLLDPEEIDQVLVSYMKEYHLEDASVVLPVNRPVEFMKLSRFCEDYSLQGSANINILNYKNVIQACMILKNSICPLRDGVFVLQIEGRGRYEIRVEDGVADVRDTTLPYELTLSHMDASALLFSNSSFAISACNHLNPLIRSWFPLPFFFPELDNV